MTGYIYILAASLLFLGVGAVLGALRLRRIRRSRVGKELTRSHFVDRFRHQGIPDNIAAGVFDYYTSSGSWKDFPLSPDDKYANVLYDDPEEIGLDAQKLIEQLGMKLPPEYVCRSYGEKRIETLRDMVLWLDWIRQHQAT